MGFGSQNGRGDTLMALTPQIYYNDLASFRAATSFPFGGFSFDQLAWAVASALATWGPSVMLQGLAVGTAGAGALAVPSTRMFLLPNPPLVIAGLSSAGMVGPLGVALGTVIGLAVPKTISSWANYAGGVTGVGVGQDVSKVTRADATGLLLLLLPTLQGLLGSGAASPQLAKGLSTGIASLLLTATGTGTVVGSPSIAPASGASTSVMV